MLGYKHSPWKVADCLLITKAFAFIGLGDIHSILEKFLIELVQHDVSEDKIKELYPGITEEIDINLIRKINLQPPFTPANAKWLKSIMHFSGSNNWLISGKHTKSGKPISSSDPHIEINKVPSSFQETIIRTEKNTLIGGTIPGIPGIIIGRSEKLSWSLTMACMDMIDLIVEDCNDGKYKRGDNWIDFQVREELIKVKKGAPVIKKYYENEHGALEGNPYKQGYYIIPKWASRTGCGSSFFIAVMALFDSDNAIKAKEFFKEIKIGGFNWVFADINNNITYQMCGRVFNRPKGINGLLPIPGWDKKYEYKGYLSNELLPNDVNPECGYIITANHNLNHLGTSNPLNMPVSDYRFKRIKNLIDSGNNFTTDDMKKIQYDVYSQQAEKVMKAILPYIPDTKNGKLLKEWNYRCTNESKGAYIFYNIYNELIERILGDTELGIDIIRIIKNSVLYIYMFDKLDSIIINENSAWVKNIDRKNIIEQAVSIALSKKAKPYKSVRKIIFPHILFGGKFPRFMGFNYGPFFLNGATPVVKQSFIFKFNKVETVFSAGYRMITDLAEKEVHTNLPGGATDRRYSKWYSNDIKNWIKGIYKILK